MALTLAQLQGLNTASFPDNNAQLITPQVLRDYNYQASLTLSELPTGSLSASYALTASYALFAANGGGGFGTGSSVKFTQTTPSTTWSFNHGLNEQYPSVTVYSDNDVIIPSRIEAVDGNNITAYFEYPTTGVLALNVGGYTPTASLAETASYSLTSLQALSASFVQLAQSASSAISASLSVFAISASYSQTASYALNVPPPVVQNLQQVTTVGNTTNLPIEVAGGVFVGKSADGVLTNTAIGTQALGNNAGGGDNTAVGYTALESNTTGTKNTALGNDALRSTTAGDRNTAIGNQSLTTNTVGVDNTAVGNQALFANTIGDENIAIGGGALQNNTTGDNNTAVGWIALQNATATHNIAVGHQAGTGFTTGDGNTIIGGYTDGTYGTEDKGIFLADGYGNLRLRFTGSDGTGYLTAPLSSSFPGVAFVGTASWALNSGPSVSSSYAGSSSYALTASYIDVTGSGIIINWSGTQLQLTASTDSASYAYTASSAVSASVADTASYSVSSSYSYTASSAVSASYSETASYSVSSSYSYTASSAVSSAFAETASYAYTASSAVSASYTETASYAYTASSAISASYTVTASYAVSASYTETASYAYTASSAISASQSETASYVDITGSGIIVNYDGTQIQLTASADFTVQYGTVSAAAFGGTPRTASVVLPIPYTIGYTAVATGGNNRIYTIAGKTLTEFVINTNSSIQPTVDVDWISKGA